MPMNLIFKKELVLFVLTCFVFLIIQSCNTEPVEIPQTTENDSDGDGVLDENDNCSLIANPNQEDDDGDGIGNLCDDDFDDPTKPLAVCENGFADIYPCNDYDLMSKIPLRTFDAAAGNDSWGWTDTTTGKEYALMATDANTAFIDISDAINSIYLGNLPTTTVNTS